MRNIIDRVAPETVRIVTLIELRRIAQWLADPWVPENEALLNPS